jgi:hypothetical protein
MTQVLTFKPQLESIARDNSRAKSNPISACGGGGERGEYIWRTKIKMTPKDENNKFNESFGCK